MIETALEHQLPLGARAARPGNERSVETGSESDLVRERERTENEAFEQHIQRRSGEPLEDQADLAVLVFRARGEGRDVGLAAL